MFSIFRRKATKKITHMLPIEVDMHSHLLAGLDDGVKTIDEALEVLRNFSALGLKKVVTTPHIMSNYYDNSPETILPALEKLREAVAKSDFDMQIEAAAEYYLDDWLYERIQDKSEFLTFGKNYMLVETAFMGMPHFIFDAFKKLVDMGIRPIFAHPERYIYLQQDYRLLDKIMGCGVYMQLNLGSLAGAYSKGAQKLASRMIKDGKVHFVGTDCHNPKQLSTIQRSLQQDDFQRLISLNLLNNTLLV